MQARTNDLKSFMNSETTNSLSERKERIQKRVQELRSSIQKVEIELFDLETEIVDLKEDDMTPKVKRNIKRIELKMRHCKAQKTETECYLKAATTEEEVILHKMDNFETVSNTSNLIVEVNTKSNEIHTD